MDVAEQRFAEANTLCAPFDAFFQKALDAVKHAETERRVAEHKLAESGIRGRRQLRAEHAVAGEGLTVAEEQLIRVKEKAYGPNCIRTEARQDLEAARRDLRSHDQIGRWSYLPERLQAIEDGIDALDTWRDWANGKPIDGARLVTAVSYLHELSSISYANGTRLLAEATYRWAARKGIELQPIRQPAVEPIGIELDL